MGFLGSVGGQSVSGSKISISTGFYHSSSHRTQILVIDSIAAQLCIPMWKWKLMFLSLVFPFLKLPVPKMMLRLKYWGGSLNMMTDLSQRPHYMRENSDIVEIFLHQKMSSDYKVVCTSPDKIEVHVFGQFSCHNTIGLITFFLIKMFQLTEYSWFFKSHKPGQYSRKS